MQATLPNYAITCIKRAIARLIFIFKTAMRKTCVVIVGDRNYDRISTVLVTASKIQSQNVSTGERLPSSAERRAAASTPSVSTLNW